MLHNEGKKINVMDISQVKNIILKMGLFFFFYIFEFTSLNIIFGSGGNFACQYFIFDFFAHEQKNVGNVFILLCTDLEKLNAKSFC